MTPTKYEQFLSLIAPVITKSSLRRETIGASERLMVTLRYIFGGTSQIDLAGMFRISPTSIGRIINETSIAIWTILLSKEYISYPKSENEWKFIANEFERKWNFSNCIGAIDGKHIVMQAPSRSGSFYFNYKKSHSIVLMAVCNANYEFTLVDIGDTGRNSDGGVFGNSKMGIAFETKLLHIPEPNEPSGSSIKLPYVLIGDEAFPLKKYHMKPYPREILSLKERIYNYRLSRARRIIENTFGILAARCRIFRKPIIAKEEVVINVTKAATALHNYLMHGRQFEPLNQYCPSKLVDYETPSGLQAGEWRSNISDYQGLTNLQKQLGSNNYTRDAKTVRELFRDFFSSPQGQVPWQYDMVTRTQNMFDQE
ncbi:putative nuclease HARBI1 [Hydra vulgaris]|uniref:putative nuclease HARBI1 n=1 Tax=Hydra vulgaris TaxID=6087 RepID=UPI001F5FC604|nr:putative nuclease HARBI1 [Hydra vulgaris]